MAGLAPDVLKDAVVSADTTRIRVRFIASEQPVRCFNPRSSGCVLVAEATRRAESDCASTLPGAGSSSRGQAGRIRSRARRLEKLLQTLRHSPHPRVERDLAHRGRITLQAI